MLVFRRVSGYTSCHIEIGNSENRKIRAMSNNEKQAWLAVPVCWVALGFALNQLLGTKVFFVRDFLIFLLGCYFILFLGRNLIDRFSGGPRLSADSERHRSDRCTALTLKTLAILAAVGLIIFIRFYPTAKVTLSKIQIVFVALSLWLAFHSIYSFLLALSLGRQRRIESERAKE